MNSRLNLDARSVLTEAWFLIIFLVGNFFQWTWKLLNLLTWLINLKSWLTNTIPPSKSFTASARASMVSISKWFVGSSSKSRCGHCHASHANTTLHLWPSDNCLMGQTFAKTKNNDTCRSKYKKIYLLPSC